MTIKRKFRKYSFGRGRCGRGSFGDTIASLLKYKLTFYADYRDGIHAKLSKASPIGTVTADRSTNAQGAYFTEFGKAVALTTSNTPTITQGYYGPSGWVASPGLSISKSNSGSLVCAYSAMDSGTWAVSSATNSCNYTMDTSTKFTLTCINTGATSNSIGTSSPITNGKTCKVVVTTAGDAGDIVWHTNGNYTSAYYHHVSIFIKASAAVSVPWKLVKNGDPETVRADLGTITTIANEWVRVVAKASYTGADAQLWVYLGGLGTTTFEICGAFIATEGTSDNTVLDLPVLMGESGVSAAEVLTYPAGVNRTAAAETVAVQWTPFASATTYGDVATMLDSDTKCRTMSVVGSVDQYRFYPNFTDSSTAVVTSSGTHAAFVKATWIGSCQYTGNPNTTLYKNGSSAGSASNTDFTAPAIGTNWQVGRQNSATNWARALFHKVAVFGMYTSSAQALAINYHLAK